MGHRTVGQVINRLGEIVDSGTIQQSGGSGLHKPPNVSESNPLGLFPRMLFKAGFPVWVESDER